MPASDTPKDRPIPDHPIDISRKRFSRSADDAIFPLAERVESDAILGFDGEFQWMSNFWPVSLLFDGVRYGSVEQAYQAAKTLNLDERLKIQMTKTPSRAKKQGRSLTVRSDWDAVKIPIMLRLQRQKYRNGRLSERLAATGKRQIFELNAWNDVFWGVVENEGGYEGVNAMGQILSLVRDEVGNKIIGAAAMRRS